MLPSPQERFLLPCAITWICNGCTGDYASTEHFEYFDVRVGDRSKMSWSCQDFAKSCQGQLRGAKWLSGYLCVSGEGLSLPAFSCDPNSELPLLSFGCPAIRIQFYCYYFLFLVSVTRDSSTARLLPAGLTQIHCYLSFVSISRSETFRLADAGGCLRSKMGKCMRNRCLKWLLCVVRPICKVHRTSCWQSKSDFTFGLTLWKRRVTK